MTLSAASALFYWTGRGGSPIPIVGGDPVHARSSAASWIDQRGRLQTGIINTPRFEWIDLGDGALARQVMLLEQARANQVLFSSDLSNGAWVKNHCSIVTGVPDPTGGTNACTVTATAANATTDQLLSAGSSLVRMNSVFLRRRTGTGVVKVLAPDSSAYVIVALTDQYQRFLVPGSASTTREAGINILTSGDAVDHFGFQLEDGPCASAYIPTLGTSVTRATDSFYWDFESIPQPLIAYARWLDIGGFLGSPWAVTTASPADPEMTVYNNSTRYAAYVNGFASAPGTTPGAGQLVEYLLALDPSANVTGIISLDRAAVVAGAPTSTTIPPTWKDTKLWLNAEGSLNPGVRLWAEFKMVKFGDVVASTPQGMMDELRAYELGANGAIL